MANLRHRPTTMLPSRDEFWIERTRRDREYHRATFSAVVTAVNGDGTVDVRMASGGGGSFYRVPVIGDFAVGVGSLVTVQRVGGYRSNNYQVVGGFGGGIPGGGVGGDTPTAIVEEVVAARDSDVYGPHASLDARLEAGDGDLSTHKANADAHHARQHALSSGDDHTGELTDAQHGVRTQADAHAHDHLSGVSADQHHARAHSLGAVADHPDIVIASPADRDALVYDLTNDRWINEAQSGGGATADHPHGSGQPGGVLGAGVVGPTQLAGLAVTRPKLALGTVPFIYDARSLIPDGAFEIDVDGDGEPDWWYWPATTAGTRQLWTAHAAVGRRCVKIDRVAAGGITMFAYSWSVDYPTIPTTRFAISEAIVYTGGFAAQRLNDPASGNALSLGVNCYDKNGAYLASRTIVGSGIPLYGGWGYYGGNIGPGQAVTWPAGTTYVTIYITDHSTYDEYNPAINLVDAVRFLATS